MTMQLILITVLTKYFKIEQNFKPVFERVKSRTGRDSIPLKSFTKELERGALSKILRNNPPEEIMTLLYEADLNGDGEIDFEEFKNMLVNNSNLEGNQAGGIVSLLRRTVATISSVPDKQTFDILMKRPERIFAVFPPPFCIPVITVFHFFIYLGYYFTANWDFEKLQELLINSPLVFDPNKKSQLWRLFTYSLLHRGNLHLIPNMIVQVSCGFPLELLVGKSRAVLVIYFLGIVTGSLGVNLIDPTMYLVGSSGGIYALIMSYFAYFLLNYKRSRGDQGVAKYFVVAPVVVFTINIIEYVLNEKKIKKTSIFCHVFGGVTGFFVGLVAYNDRSSWNKKIIEVVFLIIYLTLLTLLVIIYLLQIRIKRIDLGEHLVYLNHTNGSDYSHDNNT